MSLVFHQLLGQDLVSATGFTRCYKLFATSNAVTVVAVYEVDVITRCTNVVSDSEQRYFFPTEVSYKGISNWCFLVLKPLFKDIKVVLHGTFSHSSFSNKLANTIANVVDFKD